MRRPTRGHAGTKALPASKSYTSLQNSIDVDDDSSLKKHFDSKRAANDKRQEKPSKIRQTSWNIPQAIVEDLRWIANNYRSDYESDSIFAAKHNRKIPPVKHKMYRRRYNSSVSHESQLEMPRGASSMSDTTVSIADNILQPFSADHRAQKTEQNEECVGEYVNESSNSYNDDKYSKYKPDTFVEEELNRNYDEVFSNHNEASRLNSMEYYIKKKKEEKKGKLYQSKKQRQAEFEKYQIPCSDDGMMQITTIIPRQNSNEKPKQVKKNQMKQSLKVAQNKRQQAPVFLDQAQLRRSDNRHQNESDYDLSFDDSRYKRAAFAWNKHNSEHSSWLSTRKQYSLEHSDKPCFEERQEHEDDRTYAKSNDSVQISATTLPSSKNNSDDLKMFAEGDGQPKVKTSHELSRRTKKKTSRQQHAAKSHKKETECTGQPKFLLLEDEDDSASQALLYVLKQKDVSLHHYLRKNRKETTPCCEDVSTNKELHTEIQ